MKNDNTTPADRDARGQIPGPDDLVERLPAAVSAQ